VDISCTSAGGEVTQIKDTNQMSLNSRR
jgi:hypothetical protein